MALDWDQAYQEYKNTLQGGDLTEQKLRSLYEPLSKDFADRIVAIHKDITKQSNVDKWWGGDIGKEDAAWDMAFRLAETGAGSLSDIGQRQVPAIIEGENGPMDAGYTIPEAYNKRTGEALTNFNRSGFDNEYNLQFTDDGRVIPYTQNEASDWTSFRDEFLKPAAQMAGSFIPGVGPYLAAANAAYSASKGDWGKALVSALPAIAGFSGDLGVSPDTVSAVGEANKYAKILRSLEDKNLLGAAFQGADLAGIEELAGYDLNDVKKAVNIGMAIKNEDPMALLKAGAAFAPKGASGAGGADYKPTTDYGSGADYSLFPESDYQGLGLRAPTGLPDVFNEDGSVNYDLFDYDQFGDPIGLKMPKSPNIESMGGGQGLRLPVDGGYITEAGFIPEGYTPALGDPSSYINKPAPGGDVSKTVQKAVSTQGKPSGQQQAQSGPDLMALLSLLGGMGGQQAPAVLTVPENSADIKLMEDIFGPSLSAPSTGTETDKAEALARLLRS